MHTHPTFWIAACDRAGGAYQYELSPLGGVKLLRHLSMDRPMWLTLSGGKLWALLRAPFEDTEDSGVAAYDPGTGACLIPPMSTHGVVGCHMAIQGEDIYVANYVSGSLCRLPGGAPVLHEGHGPDPVRQNAPHVHSVFLSPDGAYALSCDLGLDTVFVYDRALREVSRAQVPPGHGARHLVFSKTGKYVYCVNEMGSSVTTFAWEAGRLTPMDTVSVLPEGYQGQNKASAIRLSEDGEQLYVTNRGANTIGRFSLAGGRLTLLDHTDTRGDEPRDFRILRGGKYALCTDQFSDKVVLYRVDKTGKLAYSDEWDLPQPLCVEEA